MKIIQTENNVHKILNLILEGLKVYSLKICLSEDRKTIKVTVLECINSWGVNKIVEFVNEVPLGEEHLFFILQDNLEVN